ncbi:hypothetical protein K661_03016, partial [Piscirickettsia salmonis LF-89 = ATCC VR-1361]
AACKYFNHVFHNDITVLVHVSYEVTPPIVGSLKKMFDCVEQLFFS